MTKEEAIYLLALSEDITGNRPLNANLFEDRPSFNLLVNKKNLIGCEIGTQYGINAYRILTQLNVKRLYLIDPYEDDSVTEEIAHSLLNQFFVDNKIVWIKKRSADAVDNIKEKLDFVYIDGNHKYGFVYKDISLYSNLLKENGLLAGHDFKASEPGVIQAVNQLVKKYHISMWDWWREN